MKQKVAILTLPLIYNYGAILQAYALQKSVQKLGAECWLIDKELPVYQLSVTKALGEATE